MDWSPIIPGVLNTIFDPLYGRKGRRRHALAPTFDPLSLGAALRIWFDTGTLTNGTITQWTDRDGSRVLAAQGGGTQVSFDGTMVVITASSFLFGANSWDVEPPYELWQIVDQTEPAGSTNSTSFSNGATTSNLTAIYTPGIGGQSSADIGGTTLFGGDDYHGIHVIRWVVGTDQVVGWLDRKVGVPASMTISSTIPSSLYVGADAQALHLWKGRLGDIVVTKPLGSGDVSAMWDYLSRKAGI